MARPTEQGIKYFSLDVDYYIDPKFVRLRSEFGVKGEICAVRVLCAIFREGYFTLCSDNLLYKLADEMKLTYELVGQVVLAMVRCGLLDEKMYRDNNVLTSQGIQKRWEAGTRRKKNRDLSKYWLLDIDDKNAENVCNNSKNVCSNEQIKSNQIKLKDDDENDNRCWKQQPNSSFSKRRQRAVTRFQEHFCILPGGEADTVMLDEFMDMITEFDDDTLYTAINRVVEHKPKYPVRYAQTACYQVRGELREEKRNEV